MAIKHLANISLEGNEIQNVKIHPLGAAPAGAEGQIFYNTATNKLMMHNGSSWYSVNGDVESVGTGNSNTISVAGGTGATPSLTAVTAAIANGGVNLATGDQIYDFVTGQIAAIPASPNHTYDISVGTGGANTSTINLNAGGSGSGTDSVTISGTANETTVTESGDTITVGLPNDVTIGNDLTVSGDLIVQGTTTTVNSETINLADNIITLNSNATGTPSENGGIEIERGTAANTTVRWNETSDRWEFTNNGTTYYNIPLPSEYNTTSGTSTNLDTSGAQVVDVMSLTNGAVQSVSTRNLTLGDLGYTGATNANNYVHPTHPGDDMSVDTGALAGAVVISDLDFNVTTDTLGHVTDANATVSTRTLTPGNIGAQPAGTYNTVIGTDTDYSVTGVNIIKSINLTDGVVTSATTGAMQSASTTVKGLVELATPAEAAAGVSTVLAVTPAGLASAVGNVLGSGNHNSYLIGNGSSTTITVTHNWNTKNINAQLVEEATGDTVFAEVSRATNNTVKVIFNVAPASNEYRLHLIKTVY